MQSGGIYYCRRAAPVSVNKYKAKTILNARKPKPGRSLNETSRNRKNLTLVSQRDSQVLSKNPHFFSGPARKLVTMHDKAVNESEIFGQET